MNGSNNNATNATAFAIAKPSKVVVQQRKDHSKSSYRNNRVKKHAAACSKASMSAVVVDSKDLGSGEWRHAVKAGSNPKPSSSSDPSSDDSHSSLVNINIRLTKYSVITVAASLLGWKTVVEEDLALHGFGSGTGTGRGAEHSRGDGGARRSAELTSSLLSPRASHVIWLDSGLGVENVLRNCKTYQHVNHIPGNVNLYRKNLLTRTMARMHRVAPDEYNFYPKSWILPHDASEVNKHLDEIAHSRGSSNSSINSKCLIIKPSGGAQGKGIYLAMSPLSAAKAAQDAVVQEYVMNPLLIDGFKFDLRIYCLVISVNPLRVLIYKDGLVRLCTSEYQRPNESNMDCVYQHLTNYSVNKHNERFVQNNDPNPNPIPNVEDGAKVSEKGSSSTSSSSSSKRSLQWLFKWLVEKEPDLTLKSGRSSGIGSDENVADVVWRRICDVVTKTIISNHCHLSHMMNTCTVDSGGGGGGSPTMAFELLGFDILLTDSLLPVLLEVNHSPSFSTDSTLDLQVKRSLIIDTLRLLNVSASDKDRVTRSSHMISKMRLYSSGGDEVLVKKRADKLARRKAKSAWLLYLTNERSNLGGFELLYPTDVYASQATRGYKEIYNQLLFKSAFLYGNGSGNNNSNSSSTSGMTLPPPAAVADCHLAWTAQSPPELLGVDSRTRRMSFTYSNAFPSSLPSLPSSLLPSSLKTQSTTKPQRKSKEEEEEEEEEKEICVKIDNILSVESKVKSLGLKELLRYCKSNQDISSVSSADTDHGHFLGEIRYHQNDNDNKQDDEYTSLRPIQASLTLGLGLGLPLDMVASGARVKNEEVRVKNNLRHDYKIRRKSTSISKSTSFSSSSSLAPNESHSGSSKSNKKGEPSNALLVGKDDVLVPLDDVDTVVCATQLSVAVNSKHKAKTIKEVGKVNHRKTKAHVARIRVPVPIAVGSTEHYRIAKEASKKIIKEQFGKDSSSNNYNNNNNNNNTKSSSRAKLKAAILSNVESLSKILSHIVAATSTSACTSTASSSTSPSSSSTILSPSVIPAVVPTNEENSPTEIKQKMQSSSSPRFGDVKMAVPLVVDYGSSRSSPSSPRAMHAGDYNVKPRTAATASMAAPVVSLTPVPLKASVGGRVGVRGKDHFYKPSYRGPTPPSVNRNIYSDVGGIENKGPNMSHNSTSINSNNSKNSRKTCENEYADSPRAKYKHLKCDYINYYRQQMSEGFVL